MIREPWDYDRHSHRVILNIGADRSYRRQKREISIASNLLNRPRSVVLIVVMILLFGLFLKEIRLVLASNPQFIIKDIILENVNVINKDIINDILKLENNRGLFNISTKEIVKILKKDPDVEIVIVEKILPSTLKIIINERKPYFRLDVDEKKYFIDSNGIVLLRERPNESVPVITGLKIDKLSPGESCIVPELEKILNILRLGDNLGWSKFIEISKIEAEQDFISIYTRERITVKLKMENISEKLNKLLIVLSDVQRKGELIRLVDLRFKDVYVE